MELAGNEDSVRRNDRREIITVFFYHDGTNPVNRSMNGQDLWAIYFDKIQKLSKLKRK